MFRFSLERVLEYRKRLEDEAAQSLAEALHRVEDLRRRIERCRAEVLENRAALLTPKAADGPSRLLIADYLEALRHDELRLLDDQAAWEEEADRRRVTAVAASRERRLLEKLKEKQAARHARQERLNEQRVYDETATLRFKPVAF